MNMPPDREVHRAATVFPPTAWGGPVGEARMRVRPEDFRVTEQALAEPGGDGEHCWLWVRKRDSNTEWVARQLARYAGVADSAVGYAGLKDRRAVTEQWFSVHLPGRGDPDWTAVGGDAFQVLRSARHTRKLKRGALRGNRFELRLKLGPVDRPRLEQRLRQIGEGGVPNYFGPQRFGRDGRNLTTAERLFTGSVARLPRHQRSLVLSAARSAIFNRLLAERVADGSWHRMRPGEALQLDGRSACFVAESMDQALIARLQRQEIHPTGVLWGRGESLPFGEAKRYEQECLAPFADWCAGLERTGLTQARRALRVRVADLKSSMEAGDTLVLRFSLPAGAYATSVVRELLVTDTGGGHDGCGRAP